jgi:DNA-binding transcriptional MerR regulator
MSESEPGYLRIGELARRTGASPEVLRAWERRYGLLRPARSHGGFRLYTAADEARIRRMRDYLDRGVAAAEAARLALDAEASGPGLGTSEPIVAAPAPPLQAAARELAGALDSFQEEQAHAVLDGLLAAYRVETIVRDLLIPYLHELGERWARGDVSVAGALRLQPAARPPARAGARLGSGTRSRRSPGLPARRAARPRADRLRHHPAPAGLAHRLPRAGHPDRHHPPRHRQHRAPPRRPCRHDSRAVRGARRRHRRPRPPGQGRPRRRRRDGRAGRPHGNAAPGYRPGERGRGRGPAGAAGLRASC